ncbi:MAG: nucleoside monophosphate kinase [bacterium]
MRYDKNALIFLGPPGSGKTTIASKVAFYFGVETVETGRLLREKVKNESELSNKIRPFIESGKLVPSDLVAKLVQKKIELMDTNIIIFDGFPRRDDQIELFFRISQDVGFNFIAVIVLLISRTTSEKRLMGRRVCSKCGTVYNIYFNPPREDACNICGGKLVRREDDTPEVIHKRLNTYEYETVPVIKYFERNYPQITYSESVEKPMEIIFDSILTIIDKVK